MLSLAIKYKLIKKIHIHVHVRGRIIINVRRHLPYIFTKRHIIISFGRHNLATILINLRSKNLI